MNQISEVVSLLEDSLTFVNEKVALKLKNLFHCLVMSGLLSSLPLVFASGELEGNIGTIILCQNPTASQKHKVLC